MDHPEQDRPLSEIETLWSDILRAHRGEGESQEARARLVLRYIGAVRRYMTCVLRDGDAAAELSQEFAVRVLRGDFRRADPSRGRFRDFVRTAASNLIRDYHRRARSDPRGVRRGRRTGRPRQSRPTSPMPSSCGAGAWSYSAAPWPCWPPTRSGPAGLTTTSSASGPRTLN